MEYSKKSRVKRYLERYDEILCTMEHRMLNTKVDESITKYFIECMIPHHQAAIYMSENLLKYTEYEPLIQIACNIISTQAKEIEQMCNICITTSNCCNSNEAVKAYTKKYCDIVREMVYKMRKSRKDININLDFISEMIPHHEGAIAMCNNLLQYNIDLRLKEVAEDIITEQEKGVKELKTISSKLILH